MDIKKQKPYNPNWQLSMKDYNSPSNVAAEMRSRPANAIYSGNESLDTCFLICRRDWSVSGKIEGAVGA